VPQGIRRHDVLAGTEGPGGRPDLDGVREGLDQRRGREVPPPNRQRLRAHVPRFEGISGALTAEGCGPRAVGGLSSDSVTGGFHDPSVFDPRTRPCGRPRGRTAWAGNEQHGKKGEHGHDDQGSSASRCASTTPTRRSARLVRETDQSRPLPARPSPRRTTAACRRRRRRSGGRSAAPAARGDLLRSAAAAARRARPARRPCYRYARVANDVLLLALSNGMVVDAITDLGRM